jgi:hypothetical protein
METTPKPRYQITELPDGVAIRIPTKRHIFTTTFLTIWLCVIFASFAFFTAVNAGPALAAKMNATFIVIWLCGGALFIGLAFYRWLWLVKGSEIIVVSPTSVSIRSKVIGCERARDYNAVGIRNLRCGQEPGVKRGSLGRRSIAFDYFENKTIWFGAELDPNEAERIVEKINHYILPQRDRPS